MTLRLRKGRLAFQHFWGKLPPVKHLLTASFLRSGYLVAAVAGLLWTCAFPPIGIAGAAWLAPGLLAAAALGKPAGESFRIGYLGGLVHYLSMLYWLLLIPFRWHGIPLAPATGWLALSAFLALFPATWVWVQSPKRAAPRGAGLPAGSPATSDPATAMPTPARAGGHGMLSTRLAWRALWAFGAAALWVGLEMILARIFGGFPWDLLGVSQLELVPLAQIAHVTAVYGLSFLVVWLSLSLLAAGATILRQPGRSSVWVAEVFIPVIVIAVLFNLGLRELRHEPPVERTLKVTLVQPSIPQTVIWDAGADAQRFEHLVHWTDQILTSNKTDLVVWPESAVPKMVRYDTNTFDAITTLARRHRVWMIVGSDDAEPRAGSANPDEADYFNSSFLVGPDGELRQRYVKRNLVIFGEYLPLQHWLPFLSVFTPITGGFTPGTHPVQFDLDSLGVKTAVLICFEDVFPQLAREDVLPQLGRTDVKPDTDFLVNITNDGWFGEAAAQWQQGMTAAFRAIENRVPLVRCTNNGLTCWIDAYGRIRKVLRDSRGTIYGPGYLTAEIPVPPQGQLHALTFYTRHGDVFGWACVGIAGLLVVGRAIPARRNRGAT